MIQALSSPGRRETRSSLTSRALRSFAFSGSSIENVTADLPAKRELESSDDSCSLSSANTDDIEDLLAPPLKRHKHESNIPLTTRGSRAASRTASTRSSRKISIKQEATKSKSTAAKTRRKPARKVTGADGSVEMQPPSNWETIYAIIKKMREENPTAPVDTMGCAELYWRGSSPRDRRFQTLIALMLSSQTKDTVTAVAMQRLHTELGEQKTIPVASRVIKTEDGEEGKTLVAPKDSTLSLENILAVSPERLNELIRTVGFHNNKTKYIKAAAVILRDQYDSDIPSTGTELMKLPGVGPKMAYLCMSAAWGKDEGIGVDVHVHRITNLWGWQKSKTPEETRMALQSWLPKDKWHEINKLLVGLGQTVCLPVGRRCGECDLAGKGLCKSEVRGLVPKGNRAAILEKNEPLADAVSAVVKIKAEEQS